MDHLVGAKVLGVLGLRLPRRNLVVGLGAALLIWTGIGRSGIGGPKDGTEGPSVRRSLTKPMLMLLSVSFIRSTALFGITAYVPIFLTTQRNLGITSFLGLTLTAFYASAVIGQPVFGLLTERLDHRFVLAIAALGSAISIVGYVNSGGAEGVALLSLFGFFTYSGFPLLISLAADYAAKDASALGNSLVWGLGATGGNSVGPLLVYALVFDDYSRLGGAFEVMAVLAVVSAIGALLIPKPPPSMPVSLAGSHGQVSAEMDSHTKVVDSPRSALFLRERGVRLRCVPATALSSPAR